MKFVLDAEQRMFGETLHKMLAEIGTSPTSAHPGTAEAVRVWGGGEHGPGRALWSSIAEAGVFALAVPQEHGGAGTLPVELVTALEVLGRHGVPGPVVETLVAAELLGRVGDPDRWLPKIAEGDAMVSLAMPPSVPYALDADAADLVLVADGTDGIDGTDGTDGPNSTVREAIAADRPAGESLDPARRLFRVTPGSTLVSAGAGSAGGAVAAAYDLGVLLCAAQQVGAGRELLEVSVEYVKARKQFGRPIGEFQAVKHHLASALVELEFARPLLFGAALSYGTPQYRRDVSAAKAAASAASYATAKTALQVHGAIAYTDEYDPSLLIRKARALYSAWGTPADHRARVLAAL